ncbi:MAG: hypothetical protein ACKOWF_06570 [Chloroflexota bacterium]
MSLFDDRRGSVPGDTGSAPAPTPLSPPVYPGGHDGHDGLDTRPGPARTRRGLLQAAAGGAAVLAGITRVSPAAGAGPRDRVGAEDECDPADPDCEQFGAGRPNGRFGCILLPASQRGDAPGRFGAGPDTTPSPVLAGIPWFEAFDRPVRRTSGWWIGTTSSWGAVRAGHAVCLRPPSIPDLAGGWEFYDQGPSDACVGFATARMLSMYNARFYNGQEMYRAAQQNDRWPGSNYAGTSIDGGMQAALRVGAWRVANFRTTGPFLSDGIKSWAWLESSDEVLTALGSREGFVRILNSWGAGYPREVRLPLAGLNRIIREGAQFASAVDRPSGGL